MSRQDALANASLQHTIQCMKCMALQCNAMQCRAMHFMHCMVCGQDALANASWPHTKQCLVCHAIEWNAMHSISLNNFVFYSSSTFWAWLRSKIGGWCLEKMHWPMHLGHTPFNAWNAWHCIPLHSIAMLCISCIHSVWTRCIAQCILARHHQWC